MSEKEIGHDRVWEAYYGTLGTNWMRDTQKRIHWVCSMVSGRRVLDVGCSSGIVPILLGREGRTVVGIDSDPKSIAEARAHLAEEPRFIKEHIEFVEADFLSYGGLEGEQFDSVVMSELLEHLVRPADFVERAWRHMSETADIVVTVPFGINDFIDHKRTYYLTSIYRLISGYFDVHRIDYLGPWIGLVGRKSSNRLRETVDRVWANDEIAALEGAFYDIERPLRDELSSTKAKNSKLIEAERSLRQQLKEVRSKGAVLARKERLLREQVENSKTKLSEMDAARRRLKDELEKARVELHEQGIEMASAIERLQKEFGEMNVKSANALDEASKEFKKASNKIAALQRQVERAKDREAQAVQDANEVRQTVSFRLGQSIVLATRSWRELAKLPLTIMRLRREGASRHKHNQQDLRSTPAPSLGLGPSRKTIEEMQAAFRARTSDATNRLRVAGVMDEFTYHSFLPECELVQLRPDMWQSQLSEFKPDLVFIESAWKGVEDLWQRKISNASAELLNLVKWCRSNRLPTVFWNKEDPVHFGTFLAVAKVVDYVFTTDIDCIPKYKHHLGHDRVFVLPFAAQPKTHNPIELYERKDAFCFAGSYYLRYPERQRDFATLIEAARKIKPIEIYDRNYGKPHSHYTFPERYSSMILGRLPFEEIDRAYKGYTFGINVNTIKQSQTMFARRVFELLASNTVVISNFSRAMRILFGDVVLSSDNAGELSGRLEAMSGDERNYRKLRLLGLRKVMVEHTYAQRLAYIRAKLSGEAFERRGPAVAVVAIASTIDEREFLLGHFSRQRHANKRLYLLQTDGEPAGAPEEGAYLFTDVRTFRDALVEASSDVPLIALFHPMDYYGPHYLTDLAVASIYSNAQGFGKGSYYRAEGGNCRLQNDGVQYRHTDPLPARQGIVRTADMSIVLLEEWLAKPAAAKLCEGPTLAIDEFHYCMDGASLAPETLSKAVEDVPLANTGIAHETLLEVAEGLGAHSIVDLSDNKVPQLNASELYEFLPQPQSSQLSLELRDDTLCIASRLAGEKHTYIHTRKRFSRDELNLVSNSSFRLDCEATLDLHTAFEFYDSEGKKISHSINKIGGTNALAIPEECVSVRFGLRLKGRGTASIRRLLLGVNGERPTVILGQSRNLVVTKQYPAYKDLYRYGFLHSRVRAYKRHGLSVDVFRLMQEPGQHYREFEGIDVASGDAALLDAALRGGRYEHVLVHLLDEKMWEVLQGHLDKVRVTIWVHGAEIQIWQRREFEFDLLPPDEIERQKKLSDKRAKFWRMLFARTDENVHFVFVSEWLRRSSLEDLGIDAPQTRVSVVHNFVDGSVFLYRKKQESDRLRILTVRPFNKLTYGNDLAVSAIVELSRRPFFSALSFTIVGDGELFEQTVSPLRSLSNVSIEKGFLSHAELVSHHEKHGVFLIPTRMDTQGVSRDEAMASGLVPITTDVAAVPEFVDESCGLVVPAEDSLALASAIEYLYENPEIFLKLSETAARRVRSQSGFEQTVQREIALIDS